MYVPSFTETAGKLAPDVVDGRPVLQMRSGIRPGSHGKMGHSRDTGQGPAVSPCSPRALARKILRA